MKTPLPDFELGPLELEEVDADEPAIAPATARVQIGENWFLLRECIIETPILFSCKSIVFLRVDVLDSPILCSYQKIASNRVPKKSERMLKGWNWSRKVRLDGIISHSELRIFRYMAQWKSREKFRVGRWKLTQETTWQWMLQTSDHEIHGQVAALLADKSSDCAFALRWSLLSEKEQSCLATSMEGDWEEFADVLKCMTWHLCADILDDKNYWTLSVGEPEGKEEKIAEESAKNSLQLFKKFGRTTVFPLVVNDWITLLLRCFRPACDLELSHYTAIQDSLQNAPFHHFYPVSTPTHHERLEARLRLREWLSDKVAPGEIPRLLGEA